MPGQLRVLVAEDNPENQRVATRILEGAGARVAIAPDGEVPLPEWQGLSAWVAALGGRIESGRGAGWLRVLRSGEAQQGALAREGGLVVGLELAPGLAQASLNVGVPFPGAGLDVRAAHVSDPCEGSRGWSWIGATPSGW